MWQTSGGKSHSDTLETEKIAQKQSGEIPPTALPQLLNSDYTCRRNVSRGAGADAACSIAWEAFTTSLAKSVNRNRMLWRFCWAIRLECLTHHCMIEVLVAL